MDVHVPLGFPLLMLLPILVGLGTSPTWMSLTSIHLRPHTTLLDPVSSSRRSKSVYNCNTSLFIVIYMFYERAFRFFECAPFLDIQSIMFIDFSSQRHHAQILGCASVLGRGYGIFVNNSVWKHGVWVGSMYTLCMCCRTIPARTFHAPHLICECPVIVFSPRAYGASLIKLIIFFLQEFYSTRKIFLRQLLSFASTRLAQGANNLVDAEGSTSSSRVALNLVKSAWSVLVVYGSVATDVVIVSYIHTYTYTHIHTHAHTHTHIHMGDEKALCVLAYTHTSYVSQIMDRWWNVLEFLD